MQVLNQEKRKHPNLIALASGIAIFFLTAIALTNCKRESVQQENIKTSLEAPSQVKDFIKAHAGSQVIPSDIKVPYEYVDEKGQKLLTHLFTTNSSNSSWCDDPSTAPIPDPSTVTQSAIKVDCGNGGYVITVTWRVKTPFEIVATNPFNSASKSVGRIRIRDIYNTIIYQNTNIQLMGSNINYISQDPADADIRMYDVTYTTPLIAWTNFSGPVTLAYSYNIWTDCTSSNYPSGFAINTPYSSGVNFTSYTNSGQPCNRLDIFSISPSSPPAGYLGYAIGTDPYGSGCYPYGWVYNTGTQVQYRKQGTSGWTNLETYLSGTGPLRTNGFVYYWEVTLVPKNGTNGSSNFVGGAGVYEFQYRNIMKANAAADPQSTGYDCPGSTWSSIFTLTVN